MFSICNDLVVTSLTIDMQNCMAYNYISSLTLYGSNSQLASGWQ